MGARKYKLYCVKCGGAVEKYHMELRMGPKGYRSYVVHDGPCPKRGMAKPREMKQLSLAMPRGKAGA